MPRHPFTIPRVDALGTIQDCAPRSEHGNQAVRTPVKRNNLGQPIGAPNTSAQNQMLDIDFLKENFPNAVRKAGEKVAMFLGLEKLANIEYSFRTSKSGSDQENILKDNETSVLEPKMIPEGYDDLNKNLHPLRLQRGPITSVADLYTMAASMYMEGGELPIKRYDLSHLQIGNSITAADFVELHDPTSQKLSIKQFSKYQFPSGPKNMKEFEQKLALQEFLQAFLRLRAAARRSKPWDLSLEALELFLIQNFYFENNVIGTGLTKCLNVAAAVVCVGFVDFTLQENAARFASVQNPISMAEFSNLFSAWARENNNLVRPQFFSHLTRTDTNLHQGHQASSTSTGKNSKDRQKEITLLCRPGNLCFYFNLGKSCTRKLDSTKSGCISNNIVYFHKCCFKDTSGKVCLKDHAMTQHH